MFNMFIKKQWNLAIFIVLSYFLILLFYDNLNNRFSERYINEQGNYIIKTKEDRKVFFNTLDLDLEKSREIVSAIENYENYDSEIIYDEIDPALITAGVNSYATYDMIIWKEEMLNMPGKWGETISDDYFMLIQLSERFRNQRNFELNLSNNIELMDRGMRRNDNNYAKYKAVHTELKKMDADFSCSDTIIVDKILNYIERDYFIILLFAISFFSVFSNLTQNRVTNQILISFKGIRKYTLVQCCCAVVLTIICTMLYYGGVVLVLSKGGIGDIPWRLPIQAINGYENISFAFTFSDYFIHSLLVKLVHLLFVVSLFVLASVLSRNNIMSVLLCVIICGAMIIPTAVSVGESTLINTLLLGGSKFLFSDLSFFKIGNLLLPYNICFLFIFFIASILVFVVTIYLSKTVVKRWV